MAAPSAWDATATAGLEMGRGSREMRRASGGEERVINDSDSTEWEGF